jgi:hypothetical protein
MPQTAWFFYGSQDNDLRMVSDVPGHGWKASCIRSPRIPSLVLALPAAIGLSLLYLRLLRRVAYHTAMKALKTSEALLEVSLDQWHTYEIAWRADEVSFRVDEIQVLASDAPPTAPLGFVLWIDNQFAVASPEKGFHFGTLETDEEQWLEVSLLEIE